MKTHCTVGIILLFFGIVAGHCPAQDSIEPCVCNAIEGGISVQCKGPEDAEGVATALENLGNSQNLELVLEFLTLQVSTSVFSEVSSLHMHNVRLEAAKPNSSFVWPNLFEVVIESSSVADEPLPNFKEAHSLSHFEISKIDIPTIGFEFRESIPASLKYLDIRKTKTIVLESQALSDLKNLQYFIMVDLPLGEFPRDALPLYMPVLHTFILGNTKVEKLEPDFFDGMPKLEVIMLNGNKLTTLDFNLFAPIENQLTHLLAQRNPLVCDCNLLWLANNTQKKGSMKVLATCKDNTTLKRKEVTLLDENEYCS